MKTSLVAMFMFPVLAWVTACSAVTEDAIPASTDSISPTPPTEAGVADGSLSSTPDGGSEPAPAAAATPVTASPSNPDAEGDTLHADGAPPIASPAPSASDKDALQSDGPLPTTTPAPRPVVSDTATQEPVSDTGRANTMFGPVACEGSGRFQFTFFPLDAEIISSIQPMGAMSGSHVTPVDHIYITHDRADQPGHGYVVRMPGDGIVVEVGRMPNPNRPDYRIVIAHTCTLFTTFIHTGEPNPELKALIGDLELGENWFGAFPLKAGEVLSDASTNTMDFMVHDQEVTLPGFILPETYSGEPWKIHTLDPFDFYDEPLRSQVLAFNQRSAEPRGGKIDYDIDGRLVGNWFVEGTGGYANGGTSSANYWETHLAIAYHYIDPSVVIISIGGDTGIPEDACRVCAGAYGIKGNAPDPASIGVADGLVKYELIGRIRPAPGEPTFNDENNSLGVFLAEMIGDRSVRIEVFPGVAPSDVTGFTNDAVVYTR